MKWVVRIIVVVVLLVIVAAVVVYLNLNRIVRKTVAEQTTASTNLTTTLGGANLSLFGGSLSLKDLEIANPQGYSDPKMFTLDGASVDVSYGQLRQDPVHVQNIDIKGPKLVLEQKDQKFNIQAAMDQMPKREPSQKEVKVIIDKLTISNPVVVVRPGIPGVANEITVPIPDIALQNIGSGEGNQNGAALKDVVMQVVNTMAAKASESDKLTGALKQQLASAAQNVAGKISKTYQDQLQKITDLTKQLPGGVGQSAQDLINQNAGKVDVNKTVEKGIGDLLGSNKDKDKDKKKGKSATKPAVGMPF